MSDGFLHSQLADLMVNAALKMHEFGQEAIAKGGYFPRVAQNEYKENKFGWPVVTRPHLLLEKKSEFVDWSSVFGAEKNDTRKFDARDVPALAPLIEHATLDNSLDRAFNPLDLGRGDRNRWVAIGAVREAATILTRAEALGDVSGSALRSVYGEWERGHFQNEVVGDLLFPILLMRFDVDERTEILPGISIEKIPQEIQLARALSVEYSEVNAYLASAATHAFVLHDQHFDNSDGPLARRMRLSTNPPGRDEVDRLFQALTIASGYESGYAQICLRPRDWATGWMLDLPPLENVASFIAYPNSFNGGWNGEGSAVNVEALEKLPALLNGLKTTSTRAKLAARRLRQSSMREDRDDIVIDACIGIEALVGEERDELVHRMSLRASVALSRVGWKARAAYDLLKKVYGHRSKIVHGTEPKNATIKFADNEFEVAATAVFLLRSLLEAHLLASPPWNPPDLDSSLFEAINGLE